MIHIQTFSTAGTLILGVAALAFWWWSTKYLTRQTSAKISRTIRGIRLLALLLLTMLVADMSVTRQRDVAVHPKTILYLDGSRSMTDFRTAVADSAEQILNQLTGAVDIREFSDETISLRGVSRYSSDGAFSNLSLPLQDASGEDQTVPVQAAILLSDGAHNAGVQPSAVASGENRIPFYTLFIGDSTQYPDISIQRVQLPYIVYAGDTVVANVRFGIRQVAGQTELGVRVQHGTSLLARESIQIIDGNYLLEHEIELSFPEAGTYQLVFAVDSLTNEQDVANNTRSAFIQVRPSRYRVLLLAENPSLESRFLIQAIKSLERFDVYSHFINIQGGTPAQEEYDIIFTIGRPSNSLAGYQELIEASKGAIHQVNTSGLLEGQSLNGPARWNETGVRIRNSRDNPLMDTFDWESQWDNLPPVWAVRGYEQYTPLLVSANGTQPLISFQDSPDEKRIYIYAQHLWRWNFASSPAVSSSTLVYTDMLETLFYLLLRQSKQDQIQLEITGVENGQVTAETQVFDLSANPISAARVTGTIMDSSGNPYQQILFQRTGFSYYANTGIRESGRYTLIAEAATGETILRDTSDVFTISGRDAEGNRSAGHPEMLRQIAEMTGGNMLRSVGGLPDEQLNAAQPISRQDTVVWHSRKSIWLWSILILGFIGDWFIRRRHSML